LFGVQTSWRRTPRIRQRDCAKVCAKGHNRRPRTQKGQNTMTHSRKRIIAGALMSASLAMAGLSIGTGTAMALPSQPHEWCPGMSMNNPPGPGAMYHWDMNDGFLGNPITC
jgi:hypothetical protein